MSAHLISELQHTIALQSPASLLYCTDEIIPALEALQQQSCRVSHISNLDALQQAPRFEMGVVFDFLERRSQAEGIKIIGRLRNFNCEKIWVAVHTSEDWNLNTMFSLGFKRLECYRENAREICTYSYDLANYNHKRSWNNPKYWANPENWGKYRW